MDIFTGASFSSLINTNKRLAQSVLPELIKKLILNSCPKIEQIRIPGNDDVWAPGFDGIVENSQEYTYVCSGRSVWECGTNSDSLKKINADYSKRTENPLGVNKSTTEFYLVIPYVWAYNNQGCSITKWETIHHEWKKVHVFDATVMAAWINSEPAVCAWLIEVFGKKKDIGFISLSSAWSRFSSKTNPKFTHDLFLEGRNAEKICFFEHLKKDIVKVKSDTTIDAYGFCLSLLLEQDDKLDSIIVINNQHTYTELSRFCHNKTFLLNFKFDGDLITGNHVILCFNKEDVSIKEDVLLRQLPKSLFNKALKSMALPEEQINSIYEYTHGNLLSLIRRIPGNSIDSKPRWALQDRVDLLAPVLLLQNYNTKNKCDKEIISYLAGEKYETVAEKYEAWLRLEDSPIKRVNDFIVLNNYEEAWDVLRLSPSSEIFNRFISVINHIVFFNQKTNDGKCGMVDAGSRRYLSNLFMDLIFFSSVAENIDSVKFAVKTLIEKQPFPEILLEHLSLMAEATPTVVMEFLLNAIKYDQEVNNNYFSEETYSHKYCQMLFTLDELVLHEETRIQACDTLFTLCLKTHDIKYATSNSPRESLLNALCLWNDHTVIQIDEKEKLIHKYISINRDYAIPFAIELLLKESISFGVRRGAKTFAKMQIYTKDLLDTHNKIASMVFKSCIEMHNIDGIKKLLSKYNKFYLSTLTNAAHLFVSKEYQDDRLISLNYELHNNVYYANRNEEKKPWLPALEAWIQCTAPSNDILCFGWMFYDYYHCPILVSESYESDNWSRIRDKQQSVRLGKFREIVETHSINDLISLIHFSKDEYQWGAFYASHFCGNDFNRIAQETYQRGKFCVLYGLLDNAKLDDSIRFLNTLSPEEECKALNSMSRQDITVWLNTIEKKRSFWSHQIMIEYSDEIYNNLLEFNPFQLLSYYAYRSSTSILLNIDKIIQIFKFIIQICENDSKQVICVHNDIDEIIRKVEKEAYYSEEWAKLCTRLYDFDLLDKYPYTLKKYYFYNPHEIILRFRKDIKNAYSQFDFQFELPDCAYTDKPAFDFFVDSFIEKHVDGDWLLSTLGSILGKSYAGKDGIFPDEYVRAAMEKYEDLQLYQYIFTGKINAGSVHPVGDGSSERSLAEEYYSNAKKLDIDFPQTAKLLKSLGDHHLFQGKQDQLISEIGYGV